jgi:hypothetical protein
LIVLKDGLSTYTEEMNDKQDAVSRIRTKIQQARYLIFLGFAFHRQNVHLLFPPGGQFERRDELEIFATGKGMSKSACDLVKRDLQALTGAALGRIHVDPGFTCTQLFDEYWYQLALRH